MSGTSADGVDAALIETDGRAQVRPLNHASIAYSDALRQQILGAMRGEGDMDTIARALTEIHAQAVEAVITASGLAREQVALVGFHGQTIKHVPQEGYTVQIGHAQWLADAVGIPVVFDFRSNDMRHGGQGAPLVPLYHAALAATLPKPLMVVNIGGVANITWIGENQINNEGGLTPPSREGALTPAASGSAFGLRDVSLDCPLQAFDCGPGNALIDDWVGQHTGARCDMNGQIAKRGITEESRVKQFLRDGFFVQNRARSLDRNQFSLSLVEGLSLEDGAATLTAMTAAAIAWSTRAVPEVPKQLLITGGGRHNPVLMRMIEARTCSDVKARDCIVQPVEAVGWNGDMLEAEAFAYLAARSVQGLPLSLPSTTGVREPVSGGELFVPAGK
ncbi:MAG: anhydro-N-acetylmuramic acid kinase [Azospirillum brasilense]|nr:MAG: anhydro-N-acetylmuramic acid kinase [Azospirillum brasilense]